MKSIFKLIVPTAQASILMVFMLNFFQTPLTCQLVHIYL